MKNSIALIGFMGTGKTAVGKALADELNKAFVTLGNFSIRIDPNARIAECLVNQ